MANSKKPVDKVVSPQGVAENGNILKDSDNSEKSESVKDSGKLTLTDTAKIINTVVDSVFVERNGRVEFAAEYYEVLLAYMEIGAFYPETGVLENGIHLFFLDYIDGKYYGEMEKLRGNRLVQYIDNAVKQKIEAKMRQIENPLIDSLTKFVDIASVLAQKYVDDINNVGSDDIKGFIKNFAELTKTTNPQTVTDAVIKMHKADLKKEDNTSKNAGLLKDASKKQSSKAKKLETGQLNA